MQGYFGYQTYDQYKCIPLQLHYLWDHCRMKRSLKQWIGDSCQGHSQSHYISHRKEHSQLYCSHTESQRLADLLHKIIFTISIVLYLKFIKGL